jgi:hypothetical protein
MSRYLASGVGGLTLAAMVLASLADPPTMAAVAAPQPIAVFAACPAGTAGGARCGTVAVPLDRANQAHSTSRFVFTAANYPPQLRIIERGRMRRDARPGSHPDTRAASVDLAHHQRAARMRVIRAD